jgi:L-aminopeptidase/D-esterase-like protein
LCVDGMTVGALIAVNAVGDVVDPDSGAIVAGARHADGRFVDLQAMLMQGKRSSLLDARATRSGGATVIGVVATDLALTKAQARRLATMAHDGLARTLRPAHTVADGDTIFALSTRRLQRDVDLVTLGAMAAQVVATAVLRAVHHADPTPLA